MVDDFFKKVQKAARKQGVTGTTKSARDFFRKKVKELGKGITAGKVIRGRPDRLVGKGNLGIGKMYFFFYSPKHKKTLPFYDRFPLIFVLSRKGTVNGSGFLGLNLHYLPPKERALFLGKLMDITNNKRFDETTRTQVTYGLLKGSARLTAFKPTIKRYLNAHVKSRFLLVPAEDWLPAVFLPVAQFEKKSQSAVWAESKRQFR